MSLLTLNGIEIPVATDSARIGAQALGADVVADDGSRHRARSAYMDAISGVTRILSPAEALAWRGLLEGRGHRWAFDSDADYTGTNPSAGADLYSSRGLYLNGVASRRGGYRTYGVSDPGGAQTLVDLGLDSYFDQALAVEAGTTNRCAADLRQASSTTPFTALGGATRSVVTTTPFEGANCLQVVASAGGDGVSFGATDSSVPVGTFYTLSFYGRCSSGTLAIDVVFSHSDDGITIDDVFTLTTTWQRFQVTVPGSTSSASQTLSAQVFTSAGASGTFFLDAIQMERGSWATSWVGAAATATEARSGSGGVAKSLLDLRAHDDVTIMGWFYGPQWDFANDAANANDATLWSLGSESEGAILRHKGSNGDLELRLVSSGSYAETTAVSYATGIGDKTWHHVAVILRRAPATGSYKAELYVDGASVGTPSSALAVPQWGAAPTLYLGRKFGGVVSGFFNGIVDEFVVLPFALTANMIGDVYAARFSDLPRVNVSGDFVGNVDVPCLPTVTGDGLRMTLAKDATAGVGSRNAVIAFQLAQAER